ncbi:MAG: immunity 52 family protein [Gemmataceae bacterium]|nr:immunity 52 family protein [Gemmataceae bacterium]
MADLYLGAYWGARRESIQQCAERLCRFLSTLSKQDQLFSRWYRPIKHKNEVKSELKFKKNEELVKLFCDLRKEKDDIDCVLGHSAQMWNGEEHSHFAGLSITCGLYSSHPGLSNVCLVYLPADLPGLRKPEKLVPVLSGAATHWEPEWGGIVSTTSRNVRNLPISGPFADWIFYASKDYLPMETIPNDLRVYPVGGLGKIVVMKQEPVDASQPEDLARIESAEMALGIERLRALETERLELYSQRMQRLEERRRRRRQKGTEITPPPAI